MARNSANRITAFQKLEVTITFMQNLAQWPQRLSLLGVRLPLYRDSAEWGFPYTETTQSETSLILRQCGVRLPLYGDNSEWDFPYTETKRSETSLILRQLGVRLPLCWDKVEWDFPYTETTRSETYLILGQRGVRLPFYWDNAKWHFPFLRQLRGTLNFRRISKQPKSHMPVVFTPWFTPKVSTKNIFCLKDGLSM